MSEPTNGTNEWLRIYQDWFRAPQRFMPGAHVAEAMTEVSRGFVAAQTAYMQAMMSLNAKMLEALFQRGDGSSQHDMPETFKTSPMSLDRAA